MDEPFGALDALTRAELHDEFRRIQARLRKTVIIVTHDMGEAFALADRIGVVEGGRLVACDRSGAIAASSNTAVRRLLDAIVRPPAPDPARP
jgi:osmoprotectant transport system ATP-binding protein